MTSSETSVPHWLSQWHPAKIESRWSVCHVPPRRYYAVNRHAIVCDVRPDSIVVLTVIHASMDLPRRLVELRPTLAAEVEALHEATKRGR